MKILHIGKYYPPFLGGIETVNYDIVEGLFENGLSADVLVLNHSKEHVQDDQKKYKLFREKTFFNIASQPISFLYLKRIFQLVNNYDIVHIHLPNPLATFPFLFLRKRRYKLVIHWHSDIVKQKLLKFVYGPIQNNILKKADKIVTTSGNYGLDSKDLKNYQHKITTIPIGIDKNENKLGSCHTLQDIIDNNSGKKIIFSLGRLVYYKGYSYLIEAASEVSDDVIFIIGGVGPLQKELEKLISQYELQKKVFLVGRIKKEELPFYFEKCYLFCFPSIEKSEAFGVSQIEAMSYGKPVISTNIKGSGVSWVNKQKISGLVVAPKKSRELARAINAILDNSNLYLKLSEGSRQRYLNMFTKKKMLNNCIEMYHSILN